MFEHVKCIQYKFTCQFERTYKKYFKIIMTVDKGSMENVYDIRRRHVDNLNESVERGDDTFYKHTDTIWTIIIVLMLCQLIALLAALGYGLYAHSNGITSILVANITTEYINSTSLYPVKVLNGSHVWRNYTVVRN